MAEDKKVNGTLNVNTLLSDDFLYIGRPSTNEDCWITAGDLMASIRSNPVNHSSCIFNNSTNIIVCKENNLIGFKSAILDCYFERNNSIRKQIIEVWYFDGNCGIIEGNMGVYPDEETDLGITLSAEIDTNLNLVVTLNAVSANADFYYNIISKIAV